MVWSSSLSGAEASDLSTTVKQSTWDSPVVDSIKCKVWVSVSDDLILTRFTAVSALHSGDSLHVMPISSCGLRLDDEPVKSPQAGLRLGMNRCVQRPCGAIVDCILGDPWSVLLSSLWPPRPPPCDK